MEQTRLGHHLHATVPTFLSIIGTTLGLVAASLTIRSYLWWEALRLGSAYSRVARLVSFTEPDILLAVSCAAFFFLLATAVPRGRWLARVWFWLALFISCAVGANATAVSWLGGPVTFQWIYYADLFRSFTPQVAIASVLSTQSIGLFVGTVCMFITVRWVFTVAVGSLPGDWPILLMVGTALALSIVAAKAAHAPESSPAVRGALVNPVVEFASSVWNSRGLPTEPKFPQDDSDYQIGASSPVMASRANRLSNVLIVILESTGAKAVYDAPQGSFPTLEALRRTGLSFTQAYASTPSSTRSNFSIIASRYPRVSFRPETYSLNGRRLATLPSRLHNVGYRTAFFMGGEFAFQGVDSFLRDKGFDLLADMNSLPCAQRHRSSTSRWRHIDHIATSCLTDSLLTYLADPSDRPFLAIFWPNDTHFPYFPAGATAGSPRERHRGALKDEDAQVGRILAALDASGKRDETLIIVVGDHGEAFGEHGFTMHGSTIFDEETRIPFILSNPRQFAGTTDKRLASLTDVAPTVLAALDLRSEPSWQGHNLLAPTTRDRLYMFAMHRSPLIGYREANRKVVADLRGDQVVAYDLDSDPEERRPITLSAAAGAIARDRIAGWASYNEGLYQTERKAGR